MDEKILRVGHSPDADDAFMFYALACGAVAIEGYRIEHVMEDIESLNHRAMTGELEVTAVSAHAFPLLADRYWIMASGASMGEGYGPVVVSREPRSIEDLRGLKVATPGRLTTARLLSDIWLEGATAVDMDFDRIIDAVLSGDVDAGVLIHEGQLTYGGQGLHKVVDFGEKWEKEIGLPLPLGLDLVRKDLGREMAGRISAAIKASIKHGYENQDQSIPYALQFGRGLDHETGSKFVKMYVSELTIDMGPQGRKGLEALFRLGHERGIIETIPEIDLV
jgi:1,4-dihydroxy-6-naphthoate synthase